MLLFARGRGEEGYEDSSSLGKTVVAVAFAVVVVVIPVALYVQSGVIWLIGLKIFLMRKGKYRAGRPICRKVLLRFSM